MNFSIDSGASEGLYNVDFVVGPNDFLNAAGQAVAVTQSGSVDPTKTAPDEEPDTPNRFWTTRIHSVVSPGARVAVLVTLPPPWL